MARVVKSKSKTLIVVVIAVILIVLFFVYELFVFAALTRSLAAIPKIVTLVPSISASIVQENLLFSSQGTSLIPYVLVHYNVRNASELFINSSLYKGPLPSRIYILNSSNDCVFCGNATEVEALLPEYLQGYGLLNNPYKISTVNTSTVSAIQNNSILIIMDGLMPQQLVQNSSGTSILTELLNKGTSVIYIGQSFNNLILPGAITVPNTKVAPYLQTTPISRNSTFYSNLKNSPLRDFSSRTRPSISRAARNTAP